MKKKHLILVLNASLIFNLFGFSSLSINKIPLDNVVENDSSIDLIKSLNTSDIAISYLTLEGDYFYTGIDDKGNKKWSYKAQENWSGQFYVQDNIFIKDYENNAIIEVKPETGEKISQKKAEYLFWPQYDDTDKKKSFIKIWAYQSYPKDILVVNKYYKDYSFTYKNIELKLKDGQRTYSATEYLNDKEALLLTKGIDNAFFDVIHYSLKSKKSRTYITINPFLDNIETGNISISPDKKKILISLCNNSQTEIILYDAETKNCNQLLLQDRNLLNVDWAFDSSFVLIVNGPDKILYKMLFSND